MSKEYSVEVCKKLEKKFLAAGLHRPMRVAHYEDGDELTYDVTGIPATSKAQVRLRIEKFIGGGYAGQVYRVKLLQMTGGSIEGLEPGGIYGLKILVPPTAFAKFFRNLLYWVGFQGPFQPQVNPAAARAGAIWQKLIRRGAKIKFGDETTVSDIYATFVDNQLGSCGELREWVEGRTWQLEVDQRMDLLSRWRKGKTVDVSKLGSPEYRAKRLFMQQFVNLLHEMGAFEFARQYQWWTCKSQPNCLKRAGTEDNPSAGLVAVDFRAGLTLLPFLPMSPADFKLIIDGIKRGSLVQFDRGSIDKLELFVQTHKEEFSDMASLLEELRDTEHIYRDSIPDITHNHLRLFYSAKLWNTILAGAVTSWAVLNLIDRRWEKKLRESKALTLIFFAIGLLPFLGRKVQRIWARPEWRKHYFDALTNWDYFKRAVKGRIAEKVIAWHRTGRLSEASSLKVADSFWRFSGHLPLSILPAGLHRFLTDRQFLKEKLAHIFVRPLKLYFNRYLREQWLGEMVAEGQKKHMLTDEDAQVIIRQINEPYIQKYLVSLVVHLMTLPVSEIVISLVTVIYVLTRPELTWEQAWKTAGAIFVIWQAIPISPGSLVRGFYVVGLMIKERDFKNYNVAFSLAFFRVIGYLAFPIQMTYHYPALARFMASHWATEAVHAVPVFGERGALLEHAVFCLFYNWPLTLRLRMHKRAEIRASLQPRYWHIGLCAVIAAALLWTIDILYFQKGCAMLSLTIAWWLALPLSLVCGSIVTLCCGGATIWKRIVAGAVCGCLIALFYTLFSAAGGAYSPGKIALNCLWRAFAFGILAAIGAFVTELKLPSPDLKQL
jgi:hypothetical protein